METIFLYFCGLYNVLYIFQYISLIQYKTIIQEVILNDEVIDVTCSLRLGTSGHFGGSLTPACLEPLQTHEGGDSLITQETSSQLFLIRLSKVKEIGPLIDQCPSLQRLCETADLTISEHEVVPVQQSERLVRSV